jgi:hypothetical protein
MCGSQHATCRELPVLARAGGLIFYDYGMVAEISLAKRDSLLQLFYATYRCAASSGSSHNNCSSCH